MIESLNNTDLLCKSLNDAIRCSQLMQSLDPSSEEYIRFIPLNRRQFLLKRVKCFLHLKGKHVLMTGHQFLTRFESINKIADNG